MECVLADEATDMGGEYDATEWAVLLSLYGLDIDLTEHATDPLDIAAMEADAEIPSPS